MHRELCLFLYRIKKYGYGVSERQCVIYWKIYAFDVWSFVGETKLDSDESQAETKPSPEKKYNHFEMLL